MSLISIKPLSVNDAWKGRRFRTDEYKAYQKHVKLLLPKINVPEGLMRVHIKFGFSSRGSDIDNPVKPFIDIMQKHYGFNDNQIVELVLKKELVKKGDEFIVFFLEAANVS